MTRIDDIDEAIIAAFQKDGRQSNREIARQLNVRISAHRGRPFQTIVDDVSEERGRRFKLIVDDVSV